MAMKELRNYDPTNVIVTVTDLTRTPAVSTVITGYTDGTFVTCEKTEDRFTTVVGADGTISRAESANELGTITLTLKQTSPSNRHLGLLALSKAVFAVNVREGNEFQAGGNQAWINKPAPMNRSGGIEDVQWVFSIANYLQI